MSISQNFPEEGPTLNLNFAGSKVLDPRITFSRSSSSGDATYMDANGLIVTASADEPRFDHRYVNGEVESLGLLVEEQRSNTLPYSEDFSQSDWATFGTASKSSNVATAPDGNFTADSITIPTSSGVYDNIAASASTTYTFSSYIRGTPGSTVRILLNFNSSGVTSKTVTVSDVWKRFDVTATSNASDSNVSVQYDQGNGNTFYVWGAQVEVGSFPTSYIPTSGSTKTRSPDNVSMTGTNFSDWYNQSEGTVYCALKTLTDTPDQYSNAWELQKSDNTDRLFVRYPNYVGWECQGQTSLYLTRAFSQNAKMATAYKTNDTTFAVNSSYAQDTSVTIGETKDELWVGSSGSGNYLNGHISQLTYYPTRLSNTVLQNLTK